MEEDLPFPSLLDLSYFRLFFRKNPAFFIFPGEKRGHEKRAAASSALLRVSPLAGPNCATAPTSYLLSFFGINQIGKELDFILFLQTWEERRSFV